MFKLNIEVASLTLKIFKFMMLGESRPHHEVVLRDNVNRELAAIRGNLII